MSASGRVSPKYRDLKNFVEDYIVRRRSSNREMQKSDRDAVVAARRGLEAMILSVKASTKNSSSCKTD